MIEDDHGNGSGEYKLADDASNHDGALSSNQSFRACVLAPCDLPGGYMLELENNGFFCAVKVVSSLCY